MNNLENMRIRLNYRGGQPQQDRLIRDKRKTLDKAILYSYQGAQIRKLNDIQVFGALINPNKNKLDYDDKIISVGFEADFAPGTVFEWLGTQTKWLVYLQDLTELAYFRGDIRRCNYEISWLDEQGQHTSFAAVRGPVETKINYIQKNGISVDTPNHSLNLLMPKTAVAESYFQRYSKFYLQGTSNDTCWRVEGVDSISTPGIIEVVAVEYYANEFEDSAGIAGNLIAKPTEEQNSLITGEGFILPKIEYTYTYEGAEEGEWSYDKNLPIEVIKDGKSITVAWIKGYSGQFTLTFGETTKTIVVQSLF